MYVDAAADVGDGAYCCDWTLVIVHMVVAVDVVADADAGQKADANRLQEAEASGHFSAATSPSTTTASPPSWTALNLTGGSVADGVWSCVCYVDAADVFSWCGCRVLVATVG